MQTNKVPLPSFIDEKATGSVNVSLQFESAPSINYTLFLKNDETNNASLYQTGTGEFSAFSTTFKLGNSNLSVDPINGKKILSVNLVGRKPASLSETDYKEKLKNGENVWEVDRIGSGGGGTSISSTDIISLEVNYARNDSRYWTFTPVRLLWGESEYTDNNDGNPQTNRPIFEAIPQPEYVYVNDPETAATAPNTGVIRDFTMTYDVSGTTKTRETNVYNGTRLTRKLVEIYGYIYQSDQVADRLDITNESGQTSTKNVFNESPFLNYWRLVEWFVINFNYDVSGYYLGYDKNGSKLVRYKAEEDFEILKLLNQDVITPADTESAQDYRFFWTPIKEYERLELHAYHNYFEDARPTINDLYIQYEEWDNETQRYRWRFEPNREYILPMFVKQQLNYSRCFAYKYIGEDHDLNGTNEVRKLITTGEESKTLVTTNILDSSSGTSTSDFGGNTDEKKQEVYETLTETTNAQDDNFRNFVTETTSESSFGRPPQADYYPVYQLQQEQQQNLNQSTPNVDARIYFARKASDSVNLTDRNQDIGSVTYETADSAREAFEMLKKDLRKQMLFQGDEFVVTCLYSPNIKPNQGCVATYKGRSYGGIVKSVDHNIEILGRGVGKGFTTVTVAMENQKNNMWEQLVMQSENNPNLPQTVWTPPLNNPGFTTLGNVSDIQTLIEDLPTRGNI
jgi:hypothetical protein